MYQIGNVNKAVMSFRMISRIHHKSYKVYLDHYMYKPSKVNKTYLWEKKRVSFQRTY